ncbi:MAG: iron-containing alcohol dehydrogenase, partial [Candidatus Avispirillum sp.]
MNVFSKAFCRVFQFCFHMALPLLPYREPKLLKSVSEVVPLLRDRGIGSVLLVTDKGLRSAGVTASLEKAAHEGGILLSVYDGTNANPTVHNVEEAVKVYTEGKCQCLIAFGGGSSMDCAKAVGARIAYPKKTVGQLKGLLKVWRKIPLLIAIPTTAGTG